MRSRLCSKDHFAFSDQIDASFQPIPVHKDLDAITVAYGGQPRYVFPKVDCALLPIPNTTVEMLAQYLAGRARSELERTAVALTAIEIEIEENFGQSATYRESLA